MSNLDKRLERIENRVEILLERQRLSRFDNLMFLTYPVVIFGITLSLTLSIQYDVIRNILLWGNPMVLFLEVFRALILVGLGGAFLFFCLAYATDRLELRLASLRILVVFTLGIVGWIFLTLLGLGVLALFGTFAAELIFLAPLILAFAILGAEALGRLVDWVASWFEKRMPITVKAARASLGTFHRFAKHRLVLKASWSASSLMYFVILVIAALRGQLMGGTGYDAFYVAAFLTATEAIILWRL